VFTAVGPQALDVIKNVRTEPCGNIRRINVEIPTLSVSDMKRLKALDCVRVIASSNRQSNSQLLLAAYLTSRHFSSPLLHTCIAPCQR